MEKLAQSRLASVLTVLVGAWLMLSPMVISISGGALTNLLIVGGVFIVAGLVQLFWVNSSPSWINALAAIWLFIAAFAFNVSTGAAWNEAVAAIVAFILASWDGAEIAQVHRGHHAST